MQLPFELGPIRPPSEAYSLLIRASRNCAWNRCKFCRTYKGQRFELRPVEDIKRDILTVKTTQDKFKEMAWKSGYGTQLNEVAAQVYQSTSDEVVRLVALWMYAGGTSAFLQDANTLIMRVNDLLEVITFLKQTLPSITRVTTYARSKTAAQRSVTELVRLREAGLSRIHIGLESGSDAVLILMDKGVTVADQIKGGQHVVASGISLCEYVLLGLGGVKLWREHAIETTRVLNDINPEYIRFRTLSITKDMPLHALVQSGEFVRSTDEQIVAEERLLIENLTCHSNLVSDHVTNLLQEIEGRLPEDKPRLLEVIDRFQGLTPAERSNFILGRRAGYYNELDDMKDATRRSAVERMLDSLCQKAGDLDEKVVYGLMERFI